MKPESARYAGKKILAPMVKIGTLPTRILALRYGADLVYSEEIIDWKFLKSQRIVNELTNTIDYIDDTDGSVFFQTCEEERDKVILQIGTCDPERALKVAQMTQGDVSGLDINMGCPKEFSIHAGMGAALLTQPEKIEKILTTLVSNLQIPVTCKVRVLSNVEDSLKLCKLIESCGVAAIGIHGRTRYERPQHQNRNHFIKELAEQLSIPVIANGGSKEIRRHEDIETFRVATGSSSVMLARAAEWNPSIFSSQIKPIIQDVIPDFLRLAVQYNLSFTHTKYTIQMMMRGLQESPLGKQFLATQVISELCEIFGLSEFYQLNCAELATKSIGLKKRLADEPLGTVIESKKSRPNGEDDDDTSIVIPNCIYVRGHYPHTESLPKSVLLNFGRTKLSAVPAYSTKNGEKRFRATVTLGGQTFRTDIWEKSKKAAEQAAAIACLKYLGIPI